MDPSSLSPSKPAAPTAAQPILASALLSNLLHRHYNQLYHEPLPLGAADPAAAAASRGGSGVRIADQREYKIRTGNAEVDDYVLLGGVERGVVLGLSSDIAGGEEVVGRVVSGGEGCFASSFFWSYFQKSGWWEDCTLQDVV
jgi:hypothetical protein